MPRRSGFGGGRGRSPSPSRAPPRAVSYDRKKVNSLSELYISGVLIRPNT